MMVIEYWEGLQYRQGLDAGVLDLSFVDKHYSSCTFRQRAKVHNAYCNFHSSQTCQRALSVIKRAPGCEPVV
jgi:hypothetical protein